MDVASIFEERKTRILRAVSFERPDRVPVVLEYAGFAALVTDTPMAEFVSTPARATQTMIEGFRRVGGGDAINYGSFSPYGLSYSFGAKVRVPGIDLPPDEIWQVLESEVMTREDYDRILDIGWKAFFLGLHSLFLSLKQRHQIIFNYSGKFVFSTFDYRLAYGGSGKALHDRATIFHS